MMHISRAPLVAAFSEAGGLGCLASSGMTEGEFRQQIALIREQTDLPFAINIVWITPNAEEIVQWSIEENIGIFISSAGLPEKTLRRIKSAEGKIFQVVANVMQAQKAEALGVDGVIAKGFESGGVNSLNAIATLPLVPQIVDAVSIPVIAAGGIGDGRGLVAAFALGADGVLMGTKFLVAHECPIHENFKKALMNAIDTDTTSIHFPEFSIRFWKNKKAMELVVDPKVQDLPWKMGPEVIQEGDTERILLGAGQIVGLVKTCVSVQETIDRIISEWKMTMRKLQNLTSFEY